MTAPIPPMGGHPPRARNAALRGRTAHPREIEANLSVTDPKLVQQVSDTTLYRHAARMVKLAVVGFVAGLVLLVLTFTTVLALAVVGFLVMLFCLLVIERNVRKVGRAGLESSTGTLRGGSLEGYVRQRGSQRGASAGSATTNS